MTTRTNAGRRTPRRCRGDDGASLVEFSFIAILLLLLLFGIINFGLILSFRQDVTRAAAEGARGGAVAVPLTAGQSYSAAAQAAATSAVNDAVKSMGHHFEGLGCSSEGMTCTVDPPAACGGQTAYKCITVTVSYDYEHHPLFGDLPLMKPFLPKKVEATSVARINS